MFADARPLFVHIHARTHAHANTHAHTRTHTRARAHIHTHKHDVVDVVITSSNPTVPFSFTGSVAVAYHDHDDQQLIYDAPRDRWVVSQITFQNYTTPGFTPTANHSKKYCDNAGG